VFELRALRLEVDGLRLCGLELAFGQRHVGAQHGAGGVLVLREFERLGVGRGGAGVQVALQVDDADLQVVLRERGLDAQARAREVVGAGLRWRIAGLDRAAHGAPDVGLPARGEAQGVGGAELEGAGAVGLRAGRRR
jgi:hypothetical protein